MGKVASTALLSTSLMTFIPTFSNYWNSKKVGITFNMFNIINFIPTFLLFQVLLEVGIKFISADLLSQAVPDIFVMKSKINYKLY